MNARWITALLLLLCGTSLAGDPQEELQFASRLGARGLTDMAIEILDALEKSSDPAAARAGRYGKAMLRKQQASIARATFLRDLDDGRPPRVKRDDVLAAYADARPKIEDYVNNRKEDLDARFLLGELLQEYAEFLTGADYPDTMAEEHKKLVEAHANDAEKLFEAAIGHYAEVIKTLGPTINANTPLDDRGYIRFTNAQYKKANARLRWAMLYPSGPKFQFRSEEAIEELDEFLSEHFEDIFGGYAMLDLGICNMERGLRLGVMDDAETAVNYFSTLYGTIQEDPTVPETIQVVAKAFYQYAKACNAIARGDGALKKAQPIYFENTIRGGAELKTKLKHGYKHPDALKAMLLVAEAYAAQDRHDAAVALAGEALATARVEGHRQVQRQATAKLTGWVAQVKGAGALAPGLLFQIGESLAAQGRVGNCITFYEKAVAASEGDEDQEKWAFPAQLRIANEYRKDKRLYAGAQVAQTVVDEYLRSGQEEDSAFGQVASEACNVARLCWKAIAENTKRSADESRYQSVLDTFRDKFPGHPENSDAAFGEARDVYSKGDYAKAASMLKGINPQSRNYWLAQRMVPACFRNLATADDAGSKAEGYHQQALEAAQALVKLAQGKEDPQAQKALQYGLLFTAMQQGSLEQWEAALQSADNYLSKYPDQFAKRGLELKIKIDAHLALDQLDKAESALKTLRSKLPQSAYVSRATFDVYTALREKYKTLAGKERTDMAGRAADLYALWLATQKDPDYKLEYFHADVLADAHRFLEAGDAYESAADGAPDEKMRAAYRLKAAEMKYRYAMESGEQRSVIVKVLEETRDLYTDVLIPPDPKDPTKAKQKAFLKKFGGPKWPGRDDFKQIKRNAEALLVAAEIYAQSSPQGLDGRQIALRLIFHLHGFTRADKDPAKPKTDEMIPYYWGGAELKLKLYLAIAESGGGEPAKQAAKDGHAYAKKLIFQFPSADGPDRATSIKALEARLKVLAR